MNFVKLHKSKIFMRSEQHSMHYTRNSTTTTVLQLHDQACCETANIPATVRDSQLCTGNCI